MDQTLPAECPACGVVLAKLEQPALASGAAEDVAAGSQLQSAREEPDTIPERLVAVMLGGGAGAIIYLANTLFYLHGDHSFSLGVMRWFVLAGAVIGLFCGLKGASQLFSLSLGEARHESTRTGQSFGVVIAICAAVVVSWLLYSTFRH